VYLNLQRLADQSREEASVQLSLLEEAARNTLGAVPAATDEDRPLANRSTKVDGAFPE
jgi:hypothetical protein